MSVALAVLAVLAACGGPGLPDATYWPSEADHAIASDVLALYAEHSPGASLASCEAERSQLRIVLADDASFGELCSYCPPGRCPGYRPSVGCPLGCASECYRRAHFYGPLGTETIAIVIHESQRDEWDAHLRHGLGHWVSECAGGGADRLHEGPIWEALGFR